MDIVETLSQPLSMSMFRNTDDLYAEMTLQRLLAAQEITRLRSELAKVEAERATLQMHAEAKLLLQTRRAARAEARIAQLEQELRIANGGGHVF